VSAPTLVLLHGWGLTPRVWHGVQAALSPTLEILAPSLPGHGDAPPAGGPGLSGWSDALLPAIPAGSVVCGWSLGGLLALDLARRHPQRVSRVVLIGTSPCFVARGGSEPWPHGLAAQTVAGFMADFAGDPAATLRRFIALQAVGDARRRAVNAGLGDALAPVVGDTHRAALADGLRVLAETDLRAAIAGVAQPVHGVHGAGDALMPVAGAQWLAARLPHGSLSVLEDCGHAPLLSRPAECAALIEAALRD